MPRTEVYQDKAGKWRWRLWGDNNEKMAGSGQSFSSREHAQRAVEDTARAFLERGPEEGSEATVGDSEPPESKSVEGSGMPGINDPSNPGEAKREAWREKGSAEETGVLENLRDMIRREPAMIQTMFMDFVALFSAFGFAVTDQQVAAIAAVVGSVLIFLGGIFTRSKVSPASRTGRRSEERHGGK